MANRMTAKLSFLKHIATYQLWGVPTVLSLVLFITAQFNFLLFHTSVEIFSIIISYVMFFLAWNTYEYSKNSFLIYLACGYFWIGSIDLLHMMTYKGMGVFDDDQYAIQFWIFARFSEAMVLFSAPFMARYARHKTVLFALFGLVSVTFVGFVLVGSFPIMFIEGQGLTAFKINSEYIIILILLSSLVILARSTDILDEMERTIISTSIVFTICAELAFTFYIDMYGLSNLLGHIFKLFSFWFIFVAIVQKNLRKPYFEVQKLSQVVEQSAASFIITDLNGVIEYVNPKFEEITQYSLSEVLGRKPDILKSDYYDPERIKNLWKTIQAGNVWQGEFCNKKKYGSLYWENSCISSIKDSFGNVVNYIAVQSDITESKNSAAALLRANRVCLAMSECCNALFHAETEQELLSEICRIVSEIAGYPLVWVGTVENDNDKSIIPVASYGDHDEYLKSSWVNAECEHGIVGAAVRIGRPEIIQNFVNDSRYQAQQDDNFKRGFASCAAFPLFDRERKFGVFVLYGREQYAFDSDEVRLLTDMTNNLSYGIQSLREAEERKSLENQLRQSHKMEAIGHLAGGIAHDFNNLLGAVMGNAELIKYNKNNNNETQHNIDQIIKAVDRGASMTQRLLAFSRQQPLKAQATNVIGLVRGLEEMLKSTLGERIELQTHLGEETYDALIDAHQFEDVLFNLSLNARDAMPNGGVLTIQTSNTILDDEYVQGYRDVRVGDHVLVTVSDSGIGMTPEVKEKIFDPFFSTKSAGEGTGLGLSMVYGFIKQIHGHVEVKSTIKQGTTIKLFLPRATNAVTSDIAEDEVCE